MSTTSKFTPEVSRQDALDFLGHACRNWTLVPPLSNDDADDVAGALTSFLKARKMPELYEALINAPIPGRGEEMMAFRDRQDVWIQTHYAPVIAALAKSGAA